VKVGYAIMYHPARARMASKLVDALMAQGVLPHLMRALPPLATEADHTSVWRTKSAALKILDAYEYRCVLQEDVKLAPRFVDRMEELVDEYSDRVLYALHYRPTGRNGRASLPLAEAARAERRDHFIAVPGYVHGAGIIVPSSIAPTLLPACDFTSAENPLYWDDDVMKHALRALHIQTLVPIPSPVEHIGGKVSTTGITGERKAWWFG
jgi:hypothetical protein